MGQKEGEDTENNLFKRAMQIGYRNGGKMDALTANRGA